MNHHRLLRVAAPLFAATFLAAQQPEPDAAAPRPGPPPAAALGAGLFRLPIHTQAADERLGAYGLWASGDTYKVSFHDGFVFYPLLGADAPANLPLRWTTTRVAVGERPIAEVARGERSHTDWRCEYRFGGVTEAYDVLPEGVEQTFVIAQRPRERGDLVIEGRIDTELTAAPVAPAVQELVFVDAAGIARVRYGKALAIDAGGKRADVTTQFDGTHVRLVVAGDWLAAAAFPVVVDPLTAAATIAVNSTTAIDPAIHRQDESQESTVFVVGRQFTSGDHDVYVRMGTGSPTQYSYIYGDVTSSWSTLQPDVAFVAGADRWVVSMWRHDAVQDRLRVYFHDRDDITAFSGVVDSSYNPGTEHVSFPTIGGTTHPTQGDRAVVVHRMDPFFGNSATSEVHAVTVDATARVILGRQVVEDVDDADSPNVNCQIGWGEDGWIVVYAARASAIDDFDVYARRVAVQPQHAVSARVRVGPDNLGDKLRAVVQGWDGRYLVAMLQDVGPETNGQHFAREVLTARLDWPSLAATPTVAPHRVAASSAQQNLTHLALGYDGDSRSHWCLTFDSGGFGLPMVTNAKRLGWSGGIVESVALGTNEYHTAVAWNGAADSFLIVSCGGNQVMQRTWLPSQHAWHALYGGSCGNGVIGSPTMPYPGSEFYRVELESAPPQQLALLCFSSLHGAVSLASIGAPNCTMNLASLDVTFGFVTDAAGRAGFTMALPDSPLYVGDIYWQFVYLWPAAPTPLAIGATQGLRSSVR